MNHSHWSALSVGSAAHILCKDEKTGAQTPLPKPLSMSRLLSQLKWTSEMPLSAAVAVIMYLGAGPKMLPVVSWLNHQSMRNNFKIGNLKYFEIFLVLWCCWIQQGLCFSDFLGCSKMCGQKCIYPPLQCGVWLFYWASCFCAHWEGWTWKWNLLLGCKPEAVRITAKNKAMKYCCHDISFPQCNADPEEFSGILKTQSIYPV